MNDQILDAGIECLKKQTEEIDVLSKELWEEFQNKGEGRPWLGNWLSDSEMSELSGE